MEQAEDFEIVEVPGRGRLMIATRDLLPGKLVIVDEIPLLFIPKEYAGQYDAEEYNAMVLAGFSIFNKILTTEKKERLLGLFAPTEGPHGNCYRTIAKEIRYAAEDDSELLVLSPEQTEIFVKIAAIIIFNAFGVPSGGYVVMNNITRMSHSCLPNCQVDISASSATLRTILPVKKGEELTLEYVQMHRLKPTHFRRHRYLERKCFTCHCPRCDAEADDTREFDCHDPQCPGSHFACQPINKEPFHNNYPFQYTGVEYVEPHLLPCTVCHRAAPLKYQQDMFALEKHLPDISAALEQQVTAAKSSHDIAKAVGLLKHISEQRFPRHHRLSLSIWKVRYQLHLMCALIRGPKGHLPHTMETLQQYLDLYERLIRFPDSIVVNRFCDALQLRRLFPDTTDILPTLKKWGQKGVRMHLVLHGREKRNKLYDDLLSEVLQRLPPPPTSAHTTDCTECMFCGESPLRAALTLSRCGRCRQVAYCSVGCQKAHWPVHKKGCKKN